MNKGQIREMLKTFDRNGKYSKRGDFHIANGGYDLWWEMYYKGTPFMTCIYGNIEDYPCKGISEDDISKIRELIKEVFGY